MSHTVMTLEDTAYNNGCEYIGDTIAHTPPTGKYFFAITALTAATVSALAGEKITGTAITTISIPAGVTIYGRFTSVTLSAGTAMAYKSGLL